MDWYMSVLKKYAVFSGRAGRKEFWMFALFNLFFIVAAIILDNILGTTIGRGRYGLFYSLYTIAVFVPNLSVSIRRLHDTNRSGWWLLISAIPVIGAIMLLIFLIESGDPGDNRYGPLPVDTVLTS